MSQLPDLQQLKDDFAPQLERAASSDDVQALRVLWLGRKGKITALLKQLGALSLDDKKRYGPLFNELKVVFETGLAARERELAAAERRRQLENDALDITLPGTSYAYGHLHPLAQVADSVVSIFRSLGFVCADGPEMESEFYNFEALNVPADHPARDMQDTFYLVERNYQPTFNFGAKLPATDASTPTLLRTHTSPVQVHVMQQYPPPIAVVCPGRVYRHEAVDATHAAVFHQVEGLLVDEGLSFADLKGTLARFAQLFFAPNVKTRFRPSFFPFTEPSAQMDVSCGSCEGNGCAVCKQTGWIELLGAGMVNPSVFKYVKIDPEKYTGFAFGMGVERLALIKYGIDDLRVFFENDLRFLRQF